MPIRMTDTDEWNEDWFIAISGEYQHLWKFIKDHCDIAGVWKPNIAKFQALTNFSVSLDSFFKKVNGEKQRIMVLENGRWFIPGFIKFQYFNKQDHFDFTLNNPLHKSIHQSLTSNEVPLRAISGLLAGYQRPMVINTLNSNKKVINNKALSIVFCFKEEAFEKKYREWIDFRKKKRKTLSSGAITKQMEFLSNYSVEEAIEILENSMRNDWQGLFEPTNNKKNGSPGKQSVASSFNAVDAAFSKLQRDLDETMCERGENKGN